MEVILAKPRGFCAGVVRAVEIVEETLRVHGRPVFVLHEIVHNRHVVQTLIEKGALFVESLEGLPRRSIVIFSAHGVSPAVVEEARRRELRVIDATCPLVTKVHLQALRYSREGFEVIIIGHRGHSEVEGTRGWVEGPVHVISTATEVDDLRVNRPDRLAYVTQTTLSIDDTRKVIAALKRRFSVNGPELSNICYATQSRQDAVRHLAKLVNLLLVVGARNSSNSNRLREVGEQNGLRAYLIEDEEELNPDWFSPDLRIGVTAGTSAPESIVQRVLDRLRTFGATTIREMEGKGEKLRFRLPAILSEEGGQDSTE